MALWGKEKRIKVISLYISLYIIIYQLYGYVLKPYSISNIKGNPFHQGCKRNHQDFEIIFNCHFRCLKVGNNIFYTRKYNEFVLKDDYTSITAYF